MHNTYLLLYPLRPLWNIRQQQSLSPLSLTLRSMLCLTSCEFYVTELGHDSSAPGGFSPTKCSASLVHGTDIPCSHAGLRVGPKWTPFHTPDFLWLSSESVILPMGWLESTEASMVKVLFVVVFVTGCLLRDGIVNTILNPQPRGTCPACLNLPGVKLPGIAPRILKAPKPHHHDKVTEQGED